MGNQKSKLIKAIEVREKGQLTESASLFDTLLKGTKPTDSLYTTVMAEYIIQLRLEAKNKLEEALRLAQKTLSYDQKHQINNPLSLRSLSHVLTDLGGFELAEPLLSQITKLYSDNSLRLGESQAHLALTWLRMGRVSDARDLISQAVQNIRHNSAKESYTEVRESYALVASSLIYYALKQNDLAKKSAQEALSIAHKGNAVFRVKQVEELLKLFT